MYIVWNEVTDMEALLIKAGITDYAKFICGYHIHGQAATSYDDTMCALDWYFQSAKQREDDSRVWEHHLILDQVCPTEYYKARVVVLKEAQYTGWEDHRVGMDSD